MESLVHVIIDSQLKESGAPLIRYATVGDAGALADLAEKTFRETFGSSNTAENLEQHCRASYGEAIQLAEIADAKMVTLVCEHSGVLIAFAQLRWGAAPDCVVAKSPAEIQRFYVASAWHGKGVAQTLMARCLEDIETRRSDAVWLGVWERNPRAITFYRKFGFTEVGSHVFLLGGDSQRDVVMLRGL